MKRTLVTLAAVTALAAGIVIAQAPAPSPSGPQAGRHHFMRQHRGRMAQALNLTDAQKAQAKTIFEQARQSAQPVREQLKQNRQAVAEAIKAGKSGSDLQPLTTAQGQLLGQMATIRTEAFAKFYATLTPEQRTKADQMKQNFHQRGERFHNQKKG